MLQDIAATKHLVTVPATKNRLTVVAYPPPFCCGLSNGLGIQPEAMKTRKFSSVRQGCFSGCHFYCIKLSWYEHK